MGLYAVERIIEKARWLGFNAWFECEPGKAWRNEYIVWVEKDGNSQLFTSARDAMEYLNNA